MPGRDLWAMRLYVQDSHSLCCDLCSSGRGEKAFEMVKTANGEHARFRVSQFYHFVAEWGKENDPYGGATHALEADRLVLIYLFRRYRYCIGVFVVVKSYF